MKFILNVFFFLFIIITLTQYITDDFINIHVFKNMQIIYYFYTHIYMDNNEIKCKQGRMSIKRGKINIYTCFVIGCRKHKIQQCKIKVLMVFIFQSYIQSL